MSYDHKDLVQSEAAQMMIDAGFEWDDLTKSYRRTPPRPKPTPLPSMGKEVIDTVAPLENKILTWIFVVFIAIIICALVKL